MRVTLALPHPPCLGDVQWQEGFGELRIAFSVKEWMLQCLQWSDPSVSIVVQHPQYQLLELVIVGRTVSRLTLPDS